MLFKQNYSVESQAVTLVRPELYLDETFRANTSGFALAEPAVVDRGVARLRDDLESGAWEEKHGQLQRQSTFDAGFRFISCRD